MHPIHGLEAKPDGLLDDPCGRRRGLAGPQARLVGRTDLACLGALVGLSLLLWLPRLAGPIDLRFDAGVYYILGTALAEGRGYRLLNEPGEIQAIQYPPLLPLLVAAHQWVLGSSDPLVVGGWLRATYFLLSTAYLLAIYVLARHYLSAWAALLVAVLSGLSHYTYFLSDLLFAEIPFALVSVLFVISQRRAGRRAHVQTALLGIAAYLLRTAGVALLAAWVAEGLIRKRWSSAATRAAVALLPVVVWQAFVMSVQSGEEYRKPAYDFQRAPYQYYNVSYLENVLLIDPFKAELGKASPTDLLLRVRTNALTMLNSLGEAVSAPAAWWRRLVNDLDAPGDLRARVRNAVPIAIIALSWLLLAGVALLAYRREWLLTLYLGASIILICLTPWPAQFNRYLAPIAPFLALAMVRLFAELAILLKRGERQYRSVVTQLGGGLIVTLLLAIQTYTLFKAYREFHGPATQYDARGTGTFYRLFYYDVPWRSFEVSLHWLEGRLQKDDAIATSSPHLAYLRTGASAVLPPFEPDTAEAQRLVDTVPVRYLIVDDLPFSDMSKRYAGPVVRAYPELWTLVYAAPDSELRIYERAR
jgi:hypothetical protein